MTLIKVPKKQLDRYPEIAEYFRSLGWVESVEDLAEQSINDCVYWVRKGSITDTLNIDNQMTAHQKESIDIVNDFMNREDVPQEIKEAYHHGVRSWMVTLNLLSQRESQKALDEEKWDAWLNERAGMEQPEEGLCYPVNRILAKEIIGKIKEFRGG